MKARLLAAIVFIGIAVVIFWPGKQEPGPFRPSEARQQEIEAKAKHVPSDGVTDTSPAQPATGTNAAPTLTRPEVLPPPTRPSPTASIPQGSARPATAAAELESMHIVFRDYHSRYGQNPVGTNAEITKTLAGGNPKKINFLATEGARLNANGELLDGWGTPYFFHQLSGKEMEIRSAGPDKQMWTDDDLVVK